MQEADVLMIINTQQDAISYRSIYLPHSHVYKTVQYRQVENTESGNGNGNGNSEKRSSDLKVSMVRLPTSYQVLH